jgi:RNA polymerase sigma-70 factor (ECF subfamily)
MTDKLRDSRGGESPYVTVLFNRYRGALHRYLSRLVATSDVPDLVQETYYRVLRHENVVEIDALARGLLFQTATNLARDHRRRNVSRHSLQHVPIEETTEPGTLDGPEERLANEQTLQLIERTLAKLPSETRAVFVLSRFKELSYPEIARAMGLSARTVARKMSEALDALASAVGKVT